MLRAQYKVMMISLVNPELSCVEGKDGEVADGCNASLVVNPDGCVGQDNRDCRP
jgi:hypothetical protein